MSESQALVALNALTFLARSIMMVKLHLGKYLGNTDVSCLSVHRTGLQTQNFRTLFYSSTVGRNVTSVCVI